MVITKGAEVVGRITQDTRKVATNNSRSSIILEVILNATRQAS